MAPVSRVDNSAGPPPAAPDAEEVLERERQHYEQTAQRKPPIAERALARIVCDRHFAYIDPAIYRGKRVLDAACGEARFTRFMAEDGASHVTGIDLSPAYMHSLPAERPLRMGDRWIAEEHPPNLELIAGDASDLSQFDDGAYDVACIFQALHHLPDPHGFLGEMRRVLVPGGALVISDPNGAHPLRTLASLVGRASGYMSDDEDAFACAQVSGWLRALGYRIELERAMSLLSEINYVLAATLSLRLRPAGEVMLLANAALRPLDDLLEATLFASQPLLGWRYLIIART